jgi:hypothetical protein
MEKERSCFSTLKTKASDRKVKVPTLIIAQGPFFIFQSYLFKPIDFTS